MKKTDLPKLWWWRLLQITFGLLLFICFVAVGAVTIESISDLQRIEIAAQCRNGKLLRSGQSGVNLYGLYSVDQTLTTAQAHGIRSSCALTSEQNKEMNKEIFSILAKPGTNVAEADAFTDEFIRDHDSTNGAFSLVRVPKDGWIKDAASYLVLGAIVANILLAFFFLCRKAFLYVLLGKED